MKIKELTAEKPMLSVGLVVILLGGAAWLTELYFKTDANAEAINEMRITVETKQNRAEDFMRSIDSRLSRIEGALDIEKGRK